MMDVSAKESLMVFLRWFHVLGVILWIGMLFFMNFVHSMYIQLLEPPVRKKVVLGMLPRISFFAISGAVLTILTGLGMLATLPPEGPDRQHWLAFAVILALVIFILGITLINGGFKKVVASLKNNQPPDPSVMKKMMMAARINAFLAVPTVFGMLAGAGHFYHATVLNVALACLAGWAVVWLLLHRAKGVTTEV